MTSSLAAESYNARPASGNTDEENFPPETQRYKPLSTSGEGLSRQEA